MSSWKINRVMAEDGLITACHYTVSVSDGTNTVETEGNWTFSNKTFVKEFFDVTEQDIIDWLKKEASNNGVCIIESRLLEQLQTIDNEQNLPWKPAVFKPNRR